MSATGRPDPSPPSGVAPGVPSSGPPRPRRRAGWGRTGRVLAGLAALLAALIAAALVWTGSESLVRWAAQRAADATGGRLEIERPEGSLWRGVRAARVVWRDPAAVTVSADGVEFRPDWSALLARRLALSALAADRLEVEIASSDGAPSAPPDSLALPFALRLESVSIGELVVRGLAPDPPQRLQALRAALDYDRRRWRVDDLALRVGSVELRAAGEIGDATPFPLAVSAAVSGTVLEQPTTATWVVTGALASLEIDAGSALHGASLRVRARVEPFSPLPLAALELQADGLDPARFGAALPSARLSAGLDARRPADADAAAPWPPLEGRLAVRNTLPGTIDQGRVPVSALGARIAFDGQRLRLDAVELDGPAGRVTGAASVPLAAALADPARAGAWAGTDVQLATERLDPSRAHRALRPGALRGAVRLRPEADAALRLDASLADGELALDGAARLAADALEIERLRLLARDGVAEVRGRAGVAPPYAFALEGRLAGLDPSRFLEVPGGRLAGRWQARGQAAPRPVLEAWLELDDSRWRGLPLAGRAAGRWGADRLSGLDARLRWGANTLLARGALGARDDLLALELDAPRLQELDARLGGRASAQATLRGGFDAPALAASATARGLSFDGEASVGALRATVALASTDVLRTLLVRAGVLADAGGAPRGIGASRESRAAGGAAGPAAAGVAGGSAAASMPIAVALEAEAVSVGGTAIDALRASFDGDADAHRIAIQARRSKAGIDVALSAEGGLEPGEPGRWRGRLLEASQAGVPSMRLREPAVLALSARQAELIGADLQIGAAAGPRLRIERARWAEDESALQAQIAGVPFGWVAWALDRGGAAPDRPVPPDALRLGARVDLRGRPGAGGALRGALEVFRESGDLTVDLPTADGGPQRVPAGLQEVRASLALAEDRLRARLVVRGTGFGSLEGEADAPLAWAADAPVPRLDVPLQGRVAIEVPSLAFTRAAIGDVWRVDGRLRASLTLAGTLAVPVLSGQVTGERLIAEQRELGLRLTDGTLALTLRDNEAQVESLRFAAGEGSLTMRGTLRADDRSEAVLTLDRVRVPMGAGQRLTLSGEARATLRGNALTLRGGLRADEGVIELTAFDTPEVSSDVVVVDDAAQAARRRAGGARPGAAQAAGARRAAADSRGAPAAVADPAGTRRDAEPAPTAAGDDRGFRVIADLGIDLGNSLRVFGAGVDARLAGRVQLTGRLPEAPRLAGTVRIVDGSYTAFGRKLEIERGTLVFSGPVDNPAIDIAAYRRYLPVEAGVQLTGTARAPQLALVSKPDVPEADKLSWLVLGSAADASRSGAENAAMQAAAATLLSRGDPNVATPSFAETFGLDVLSIRTGQAGASGDGAGASATASAQDSVVTLGKRLSQRLFVSYEQSLRGLQNLVRLQYEITERLSVRARAGTSNGVDLLWTLRYD